MGQMQSLPAACTAALSWEDSWHLCGQRGAKRLDRGRRSEGCEGAGLNGLRVLVPGGGDLGHVEQTRRKVSRGWVAREQECQPLALEKEAEFQAVAARAGTSVAPFWPPEVERTAAGGCASHRRACRRSQALAGEEADTAGATDGRETT